MTSKSDIAREPKGEMMIRTLAMPADTNPAGDIFGGWVLSQMDIAGGILTKKMSKGRTVTVAVDAMKFHLPVHVGDVLCCYCEIIKIGKSSAAVKIEAWTSPAEETERILVTEGLFTYVALDKNRKARPMKQEE